METDNSAADDIDLLLAILPELIQKEIGGTARAKDLVEVVLDLGRPPEIRFPGTMEILFAEPVSSRDIEHVISGVSRFTSDNRAGIERTLHRISAIKNRVGEIIGLTCRVGRAMRGTVDILRDCIEGGHSVLLLGRPGVGKTTLLREAARVLADEIGKRVIIVDTSNEIGGAGDIPHPGIGRARRMQVPSVMTQHAVMIEAVENHMPEVIVIDEIGTEAEAVAARTIAERGVQLIATAHGNSLENLLRNPTLADLVGGVQVVTLSDEEARRRHTRKTILERKAPPTFSILVEIQDRDHLAVHHDVAFVIDGYLAGIPPEPEMRMREANGAITIGKKIIGTTKENETARKNMIKRNRSEIDNETLPRVKRRITPIFLYGISESRMAKLIEQLQAPAEIATDARKAEVILTLKSQQKRQPKNLRDLQEKGVPIHILRANTIIQMEHFLREYFNISVPLGGEDAAIVETEEAIRLVLKNRQPFELLPQDPDIRAIQHQLATRHGLYTDSKGRGPYRRVVIYPR